MESDAISTMLLARGPDGLRDVLSLRPAMRALVAAESASERNLRVESRGFHLSTTIAV
jgi:hypothetical protein